jgi:hypothetical protein
MERKHIVGVFGYRIALALLTRSIFQPDEFFQSLEVAHNVVFGYGKLTWEWQPGIAIRSIVYPALYVPVYLILRVTGLDATGLLVCDLPIILNAPASYLSVSLGTRAQGAQWCHRGTDRHLGVPIGAACFGRAVRNGYSKLTVISKKG